MRVKVLFIGFIFIAAGIFLSGCNGSKDRGSPAAPAANAEQAIGQPSGLLLGLAKTVDQKNIYGTPLVEYRTLWISPKGTSIGYLEGPGFILTPYGNDFWKIENSEYHFGVLGENKKKYYNDKIDYEHNLVMFTSHNASEKAKPLYTDETFKRPYSDKDGFTEWDIKHQRVYEELLYAGNNYACIKSNYYYNTGGTMRIYGYSIDLYKIENLQTAEGRSLNKNKQLMDLLPVKAAELIDNYAKGYNKIIKGEGSFIKEKEVIDKDNVGLQRIDGKWEAVAPLDDVWSHSGNGTSETSVKEFIKLSLPLPESITSFDSLCKGWEEVKQKYPDAKDAVSSPDKDMLLILTPKKLMVFSQPEKGIDAPDLTIDVDESERIILNQWATGENVEKWNASIKKYLMVR